MRSNNGVQALERNFVCISNKFPGDAYAAGSETHLVNHCSGGPS